MPAVRAACLWGQALFRLAVSLCFVFVVVPVIIAIVKIIIIVICCSLPARHFWLCLSPHMGGRCGRLAAAVTEQYRTCDTYVQYASKADRRHRSLGQGLKTGSEDDSSKPVLCVDGSLLSVQCNLRNTNNGIDLGTALSLSV